MKKRKKGETRRRSGGKGKKRGKEGHRSYPRRLKTQLFWRGWRKGVKEKKRRKGWGGPTGKVDDLLSELPSAGLFSGERSCGGGRERGEEQGEGKKEKKKKRGNQTRPGHGHFRAVTCPMAGKEKGSWGGKRKERKRDLSKRAIFLLASFPDFFFHHFPGERGRGGKCGQKEKEVTG